MIPKEHEATILNSGMQFMRSITNAYGPDEGMKLWDTISSTLDPDIKGKIFFAMLTGEYDYRIKWSSINFTANKINIIRTIRSIDRRSLSLLEAKLLADKLWDRNGSIELEVEPTNRAAALQKLRDAGIANI